MYDSNSDHSPILLTSREAAKYLAICERSLFTLRKKGQIRVTTVLQGIRYSKSELDRFVSENTRMDCD
jgi:hypothetical protein